MASNAPQSDPGDENDWLKAHKKLYPTKPLTYLGRIPTSNRFPTTAVSETAFDAVSDLEQAYAQMSVVDIKDVEAVDAAFARLIQCRKSLFTYVRELEIECDRERTVTLRF